MSFWVYILASRPGGTLYVGITRDLVRRIFEHRNKLVGGFTKRYGVISKNTARFGCDLAGKEYQALVP
jgi:predicted GIY-YIG superfamily endonuclease